MKKVSIKTARHFHFLRASVLLQHSWVLPQIKTQSPSMPTISISIDRKMLSRNVFRDNVNTKSISIRDSRSCLHCNSVKIGRMQIWIESSDCINFLSFLLLILQSTALSFRQPTLSRFRSQRFLVTQWVMTVQTEQLLLLLPTLCLIIQLRNLLSDVYQEQIVSVRTKGIVWRQQLACKVLEGSAKCNCNRGFLCKHIFRMKALRG